MSNTKITVYQKTDVARTINFQKDGSALDITGRTIYFTVKTKSDDANDDGSQKIGKTITSHTTPADGVSLLELTDEDTDMPATTYDYQFTLKDADDKIKATQKGEFVVKEHINKTL